MTEKKCGVIEFPPNDKPCEREAGHSGGHTPSSRAASLLREQDLRIAELEQERDSMEVSRDLAEAEELKTRKERDSALERVKELERAYRQREEALQNLVVFREGERDSAQASLRSASAANARLSKERDEARAALTFIREQFPSVWDHAEFAPFRPILGEKP